MYNIIIMIHQMPKSTHTRTYIRTCTCTCIIMYVCTSMYTHTCTYIHVHTYMYMYMYTYTYTHIHVREESNSGLQSWLVTAITKDSTQNVRKKLRMSERMCAKWYKQVPQSLTKCTASAINQSKHTTAHVHACASLKDKHSK